MSNYSKMKEIKMGVYNADGELQDFGTYESDEDALGDLLNWDLPRGRYGVIEGSDYSDGEYHKPAQVAKMLKYLEKKRKKK